MTMAQLKTMPRWALISILAITLPVAGWAFSEHVRVDRKQTTDISDLAGIVHDLTVVVEYNQRETERNAGHVAELQDTQKRLELLMVRVETRLDNDSQ